MNTCYKVVYIQQKNQNSQKLNKLTIMAEVIENGMHKEYASVGKANASLTLGGHI